MSIDCMIEDRRWAALQLETLAEAAMQATCAHLGLSGLEVSVLGCNDLRIAELNADFRGKPTPTNVLSWPSEERGAKTDGGQPRPLNPADPEIGDIAIAYETCASEAEALGKPMSEHTTHLIVHGVLHLLGYDHDRDQDATLMEGLETEILGKMGLSDPYTEE